MNVYFSLVDNRLLPFKKSTETEELSTNAMWLLSSEIWYMWHVLSNFKKKKHGSLIYKKGNSRNTTRLYHFITLSYRDSMDIWDQQISPDFILYISFCADLLIKVSKLEGI